MLKLAEFEGINKLINKLIANNGEYILLQLKNLFNKKFFFNYYTVKIFSYFYKKEIESTVHK